ncbi:MAG: GNAT family N-acetyltransferase [Huintestinicola sp.]
MNLITETFSADKLDDYTRLYQRVFRSEPWNDNDSNEEVRLYFERFMRSDIFLGYAGYLNGRLAAISAGFVKPWVKGNEYYIDQFCVDTGLQGQGIGTAFLAEIEKDLTKREINNIFLLTDKNYPSYDFYRKNGFNDLGSICCLAK